MLVLTLLAISAGVIVGLARGGNVAHLAFLQPRHAWVVAIVWVAQALLFASPLSGTLSPFAVPIHVATILGLLFVIATNRHLPGFVLIAAGLLLNVVVVAGNGGFMPVSAAALQAAGNGAVVPLLEAGGRDQKDTIMSSGTPLWFFGDVVPAEPLHKVFSPGDLIAAAGALSFVSLGMRERRLLQPA
jgi:hypothetical protein